MTLRETQPHRPRPAGAVCGLVLRAGLLLLCVAVLPARGLAQDPGDLASKSLEELMNIKVTSASKKEEKLFKTAAAIYVITQEDIRRSGMTTIPDLLRMVPGLDVARIDGTKWAVSARGFNHRFADKLLVLVDGRSVYSPETSGVYWEALDVPLEDIDRIEVIRGPGGTLWGANAVNGVINIITKQAKDTQGALVVAGGGSEYRPSGLFQYGGKLGQSGYYRTCADYLNSGGLLSTTGQPAKDGQSLGYGCVRFDLQPSKRDSLTVTSDIYDMDLHERTTNVSPLSPFSPPANTPGTFDGGDVVGRWNHLFSDRSDITLQLYWDRSVRDVYDQGTRLDTYDLDFQHHFAWGDRQDIVWGLGARFIEFVTDSSLGNPVQFIPKDNSESLFNVFAQDQISIVNDRLALIVGTKLEHNTFSGFDAQPNIRLLWTPNQKQTLWSAVSRAVRTPAFNDEFILVNLAAVPNPGGIPSILTLVGQPDVEPETLLAYEAGYRIEPASRFSLDIAAYYNVYHHLNSAEMAPGFFDDEPEPHIEVPFVFGNLMHGRTYGTEVSANVKLTNEWKLSTSYSFLHMNLINEFTGPSLVLDSAGNSPQHQFQVRSYANLPYNFEFDAAVYYVSALTAQSVPAYTRVDARIGWHPAEHFEFSLGGENLLDNSHIEFDSTNESVVPTRVKRSIFGKLVWRP